MRLPFFRGKNSADPRAQPARGAAGAGVEDSSVQAARTRARRRLVGALVLLAAGVVGFPFLFETQPRPLPVDTPILLPEATSLRVAPAPAARPLPVVPADAGNEPVASAAAVPPALPTPATSPRPPPVAAQAAASVVAGVASAAARVAAPVVAPKPEAEAPKPEAATPLKPVPESIAPSSGRFVVQVGAYNDPERLRAARQKVEKLGYKTYTQDVDSPTGKRTRVRVGPFASRQEADAVATKVKAGGLQANILAL